MTYRFVTQRDLNGTWSVREVATSNQAIYRGKLLVGLSEKFAAFYARKLNDTGAPARSADDPPLVYGIQEVIGSPLRPPGALKDA